MSTEKLFHEAKRWFATAEGDLDTAKILEKNAKYAQEILDTVRSILKL